MIKVNSVSCLPFVIITIMKREKTYDLLFKSAYVLFIYGIGVLLTFYLHDAYYDVMESKYGCFNIISLILLPFLLLTLFFKIKEKRLKLFNNLISIGVLLFSCIATISTLFSDYVELSWTGTSGWLNGISTI